MEGVVSGEDNISLSAVNSLTTDNNGVSSNSDETVNMDTEVTKR